MGGTERLDDLLQDFIAETRDMLSDIADEIAAWEADPSDHARIAEIFRFVHTIKGNCSFLDQPRLTRLSHAAESVLVALLSGARTADRALVGVLLAVIERIGTLADAIGTGAMPPEEEDRRLIAALAPGGTAGVSAARLAGDETYPARGATVRLPATFPSDIARGTAIVAEAHKALSDCLRETGMTAAARIALDQLAARIDDIREVVGQIRMQRIEVVFAALPRLIRSVAAETGKHAVLHMEGGGVELDRATIEAIRAPLQQILRNAIVHGIEPPAERMRLGKPEAGQLILSVRRQAHMVCISIADDGRGIDGDGLARKAAAAGLISPEGLASLDRAGNLGLAFLPGLSIADTATWSSGRGMGMDVVRTNVIRLGGTIHIESNSGEGTTISINVPAPAADENSDVERCDAPAMQALSS